MCGVRDVEIATSPAGSLNDEKWVGWTWWALRACAALRNCHGDEAIPGRKILRIEIPMDGVRDVEIATSPTGSLNDRIS